MKATEILKMKRGFTGLMLVVLFLTTTIFAAAQPQGGGQGKATPEERAKRITEVMKTELNLTAAQETKVSSINLKYAKKNEEARNFADTAQRRKSLTALDTQKDFELKGVLTADQYKSYLKFKEEMKARRKQGGGPRP